MVAKLPGKSKVTNSFLGLWKDEPLAACDSFKILLGHSSPQQLCLSAGREGMSAALDRFEKVTPTAAVLLKKQQESHVLFT